EGEQWTRADKQALSKWTRDLVSHSRERMLHLGYVRSEDNKVVITELGEELQREVYKYENYLRDYDLFYDRNFVDVNLWDELMISAAMLNLALLVSEQFTRLYPAYKEQSIYPRDYILSILNVTSNIVNI